MRIAVAGGSGAVGRYVVEAGRADGHDMVVLSRSAGIDLRDAGSEDALRAALQGVDAIVDTTNSPTRTSRAAAAFFEEVTGRLHRIGAEAGVGRLVTLSIVGIDRVPGFGYYEAKQRHEAVSLAGPLPATVVRATQFHEFPAQILRVTQRGPVAFMISMRTQPIAAREVGRYLIGVAAGEAPDGRVLQIAGPESLRLVAMARRYLERRRRRALVVPLPLPGAAGRAMRAGAALPADNVPRLGPTFEEWLESPDSAAH